MGMLVFFTMLLLVRGPNMEPAPVVTTQAPVAAPARPEAVYRQITPQEAKAQLAADPAILLVDVRTDAEYAAGHIPKSILIPDVDIERLAHEQLPDTDATIFVYCRTGRRSHGAAMKLLEMGYTDVADLGGIVDWPYETVAGAKP